METKKYFKVLTNDCKAKDGGSFDYSKYVNNHEWTPIIDNIVECISGYHVTEFWNMWVADKSHRVFIVEVKDALVCENVVGVVEKIVCKSIRFIEEFKPHYKDELNTGDQNTGNRNTGNRNTGHWNTGDQNTGSLNTKRPKYTQIFNKNILFTDYDKIKFPNYFYFELGMEYKESFKKSFEKTSMKDVKKTLTLPNFNYKLFEEISGITKKMIQDKLKVKQ